MQDYREGQRLQGSDGQIYVVVNGVPTLSAAPMQSLSSIVAPSPTRVAEEQRKDAREDRRDDRADSRENRAIDTESRKAQNDALANELKRLELKLKEQELSKGESGGRATALKSLVNQINRVQTLFNSGPGTTGGLGAVLDYAPTGTNKAFDAAGASLSGQGLAAFRVPGTGTVSDRDAIMFDRANLPQASNFDAATLEQLRGLRSRVQGEYEALGLGKPAWEGIEDAEAGKSDQRADNEVPGQANGAPTKPGARMEVASGETRFDNDPRAASMLDSLINATAKLPPATAKATIDRALKEAGHVPIPLTMLQGARAQMQKTGKAWSGSQVVRKVPLNAFQQLAGSPLGAGAARFANSATAGLVGAVGGEKARGALDAMAAANPGAALAGDIAGGVLGAFGAEAGAAAALGGRGAAWLAPRLADAGFGALTGLNAAQEGEGAMGALTGAGAGLAGGYLGQKAGNAIGSAFRGVQTPAVQLLRDRGVPMTVGQVVGDSGNLGRSVKGVEDALTSVPGVGSIINARRMEGMEGFNRAAFETAGAPAGVPVTATGADGIQQLRDGIGGAYDNALAGTQIDANNNAYLNDLTDLVTAAERIPNVNGASDAAIAALDARMGGAVDATGMIPGRNFQEAYRGLARTGRERANGDYGHEIGQVMRQGQDALASALEAQNPGAFTAFRAANSTNRNANVLSDAVNRAKNAEAELFTPAQLNMADAGSARRLSGPMASAAGDRPFYDLAQAGQAVLPSKLPDSGTATRGLVAAGVLGGLTGSGAGAAFGDAQTGAGVGLGATLALAVGGSRPAQRALTTILADRPDLMVDVGNALQRNANRFGWTGAGVLTPLTVGQ